MKRVEAIIRPLRLESVKTALAEAGVTGITVTDVRGCGRPDQHAVSSFRGQEYVIQLPPKIKIEMLLRDSDVEMAIEIVLQYARTGEEGDGKIFVLDAGNAIRIRTGDSGDGVL